MDRDVDKYCTPWKEAKIVVKETKDVPSLQL